MKEVVLKSFIHSSFTYLLVQHVLLKPPVKGLENEQAGPPPSEPT